MSEARKGYPSDVSDDEWAFAAPYLTLLREDAHQRDYPLREAFNALRWVVKTGAQWKFLPHDFPPWPAVYQQARRWLAAGCFEHMAHDLRRILRWADDRALDPSAVILDGRVIQSTPESGARAGYDGHKRRKGSKVHIAVDTLGHLLALVVTPADAQEREQVTELAAAVQEATGQSELGLRRSGVHRGPDRRRRCQPRDPVGGGQAHGGQEGVRAVAEALGGGALVRLVRPVPAPGAGLRAPGSDPGRLALGRVRRAHAPTLRPLGTPRFITGSNPNPLTAFDRPASSLVHVHRVPVRAGGEALEGGHADR